MSNKQQPNRVEVEKMFSSLIVAANHIITKLETIDPTSEQFGNSIENLAKVFAILSGVALKNKEGDNK
jgi:hypothetical protein